MKKILITSVFLLLTIVVHAQRTIEKSTQIIEGETFAINKIKYKNHGSSFIIYNRKNKTDLLKKQQKSACKFDFHVHFAPMAKAIFPKKIAEHHLQLITVYFVIDQSGKFVDIAYYYDYEIGLTIEEIAKLDKKIRASRFDISQCKDVKPLNVFEEYISFFRIK